MSSTLFQALITAALFGNFLVARLVALRTAGWPKSLVVFALLVVVVVLGAAARRLSGKDTPAVAVARYGSWCVIVAASVYYEHYSIAPRLVLLLLLSAGILVDSLRHARWLSGPALSALVLLLVLGGLDLVSPRRTSPVDVEHIGGTLFASDPFLGYRPAPNCTTRVVGRHDGRVVYDAVYTTDECSRRVVVDTTAVRAGARHALFMGCSFVFGDAVSDSATLPSRFGMLSRDYRVYNYGFSGYGPQHMYALLLSGRIREDVPESSGVMLYCMFPHHIERAVGTYTTLLWGKDFPSFVCDGDSLRWTGSFRASQPVKARLFELIQSSPTLDRLARRVDWLVSARLDPRLLVALMVESAREYKRQFDGSFYVCLWPNADSRSARFVRELRSHGITVIELASLGVPLLSSRFEVPYDGHPNGAYYRLAAGALARALDDAGVGS